MNLKTFELLSDKNYPPFLPSSWTFRKFFTNQMKNSKCKFFITNRKVIERVALMVIPVFWCIDLSRRISDSPCELLLPRPVAIWPPPYELLTFWQLTSIVYSPALKRSLCKFKCLLPTKEDIFFLLWNQKHVDCMFYVLGKVGVGVGNAFHANWALQRLPTRLFNIEGQIQSEKNKLHFHWQCSAPCIENVLFLIPFFYIYYSLRLVLNMLGINSHALKKYSSFYFNNFESPPSIFIRCHYFDFPCLMKRKEHWLKVA